VEASWRLGPGPQRSATQRASALAASPWLRDGELFHYLPPTPLSDLDFVSMAGDLYCGAADLMSPTAPHLRTRGSRVDLVALWLYGSGPAVLGNGLM